MVFISWVAIISGRLFQLMKVVFMALGSGWIPIYPSLLTIKGGLMSILIGGTMTIINNIKDIPAPPGVIIIGDGMEGTKPFLYRALGNGLARGVWFNFR